MLNYNIKCATAIITLTATALLSGGHTLGYSDYLAPLTHAIKNSSRTEFEEQYKLFTADTTIPCDKKNEIIMMLKESTHTAKQAVENDLIINRYHIAQTAAELYGCALAITTAIALLPCVIYLCIDDYLLAQGKETYSPDKLSTLYVVAKKVCAYSGLFSPTALICKGVDKGVSKARAAASDNHISESTCRAYEHLIEFTPFLLAAGALYPAGHYGTVHAQAAWAKQKELQEKLDILNEIDKLLLIFFIASPI